MKKLLYIGHSYHKKTQSTTFLIHLLEQEYEVDVIHDDNWQYGKDPDTDKISSYYDVVVFFQVIPSPRNFRKISHPNIVFFPMYDNSHKASLFKWLAYKNIKIINFSRTLHETLLNWDFNSFYLQFFPKPKEKITSVNNHAFFWQRRNEITIQTLDKIFSNDTVKLHIHVNMDPNQSFSQPTLLQEEKFSITYSEWFETKSDLENCINSKTIYIAPRILEGIGMSFLEAMAKGMVVFAHNAPTMNEYIRHGENGFLLDYMNPSPINFTMNDLEKISTNTHNYIISGYEKWEQDKHNIVPIIQQSPKKHTLTKHLVIAMVLELYKIFTKKLESLFVKLKKRCKF